MDLQLRRRTPLPKRHLGEESGEVVRVTDYWGEPTQTPGWRQPMTDRLEMPGDGIWPDNGHLGHY